MQTFSNTRHSPISAKRRATVSPEIAPSLDLQPLHGDQREEALGHVIALDEVVTVLKATWKKARRSSPSWVPAASAGSFWARTDSQDRMDQIAMLKEKGKRTVRIVRKFVEMISTPASRARF